MRCIFFTLIAGCALNQALNDEFGQVPPNNAPQPTQDASKDELPIAHEIDPSELCQGSASTAAKTCCESWHRLIDFQKNPDVDLEATMEMMAPMITAAGRGVVSTMAQNPTAEVVHYARPWLPPQQEWDSASPGMQTLFRDCFGGPELDAH